MTGMPRRDCATIGMAGFCTHRYQDAVKRAEKRDRGSARRRSVGHLALAVLWAALGVFLFLSAG